MERYESLGLVGEGSYGTVLKCRHRDSGRLVAIKKFMDSDDDKAVKKIALREIKLLRQLRHDNLVNLLEVWKRRRRWYLVFEFVERTLLDDLEQNTNGLDLNTSRQYSYQILRATAFCHQQNVIHRDIKPENILISHGGVVKLCDFGFARTMATPAEGGVYTEYVATRWYRAPELLVGDSKYGKPVDVWALGCLFMEMLTGQPLFPGDSDLDQIYHIVGFFGNLTTHHQTLFYRNPVFSGVKLPESFSKVSLEQRYPAVPSMVLELTQGCLQMDPERRAECSKLLEYPLFIHDSFHIRFVDELNAKIQKEHRENSTLPKIAKTPIQGVDEEDKRSWKGKDRTMADDIKEKMKLEEKMEKAKEKQSKMSKTMRNSSEPSMCKKPSKGSKSTDSIGKMSVKNKATKYTEQSKPPKVFQLSLKEGLKPQVNDTSSKTERSADHRDAKIEAKECSDGSMSKENTMEVNPGGSKNTQSSQHQPSYHTSDTNVPNILKMVTEDKSNWTSFSSPEHAANVNQPTMFCPSAEEIRRFDGTKDKIFTSFTKQSKNTLQSQTNPKTTDEMMAADCTKQFSPKPVMKNSVAQVSNKTGSTPLSFLTDHPPTQLSKVSIEVPKKGNQKFEIDTKDFTPKISKVGGEWRDGSVKPWSSQLVPNSSKDMILKSGPKADSTSKRPLESHKKDISMSKNRTLHSTDPRPSAFEETPAKKKTTASDPESILSESQVTVQGTNKSLKVDNSEPFLWHLKSSGTLKSHTRSTVVFIPSCFADSEGENNPGLRKTLDSISFNSDLRPLTGIICSKMDNITLCEGDIWKNGTFSPPPPPPPPSGTPLLVPPSSALIMPPMSGVTSQNQAASRHLHLTSRHPSWTVNNRRQRGISSRQSLSSHLSGSNPAQLKERSVTCERLSPSDVCGPNEPKINCDVEFPDVKVLPDVQGRDGKHSRSVRKDHQPLEPAQGPVPDVSPQSSV